MIPTVILLVCLLAVVAAEDAITCGSVVKLVHHDSNHVVHSHPIAWGSGSGQQSVTATPELNHPGSMWIVKDATTTRIACEIGTPIECNTPLRLEHAQTGKNLHSHLFRAALSGNQEVSAFGDGGNGDTGDNWIIRCESGKEKYWRRNAIVHFEHVDTKKWLFTTTQAKFTTQNCGQACPIMGQTEMSAAPHKSAASKFRTGQGLYFPPNVKDENDNEL